MTLSVALRRVLLSIAVLFVMMACAFPAMRGLWGAGAAPGAAAPSSSVAVTFRAQVPTDTRGKVALVVLDEVTGLAFNQRRYAMQPVGQGVYQVTVPLTRGAMLKYRYERLLPAGKAVPEVPVGEVAGRYRLLRVDGVMTNQDLVARWRDGQYRGATGWVAGVVVDEHGDPVPDMLVTAAGVWAVSDADGAFVLGGLPVGKHMLVAYHVDGRYTVFQQQILVAAHSLTPVRFAVQQRPLVPMVFTVVAPQDTVVGAPVRLVGNLYSLGNTYGDQGGSLSVLATRAPALRLVSERQYALTLRLPEGAEVRYKYTLGDGFWNAEHTRDGQFVVRRLVVPPGGGTIATQTVASWRSGGRQPVWLEVTVPPETPVGELVDVQLDVGGALPALPMWPIGEHKWGYWLLSPTNVADMGYRFCRNEQCGVADQRPGATPEEGARVHFAAQPQTLHAQAAWQWWQGAPQPVTVQADAEPRAAGSWFWSGVGMMPDYRPSWQPYIGRAVAEIYRLHAHWVVFTPTWTAADPAGRVLWAARLGRDPLTVDVQGMAAEAERRGMHSVLFPVVRFPEGEAAWWGEQGHDFGWWLTWFDRYTAFARHFARLAESVHASGLVLGGTWVQPAVPGGLLPNGSPAGHPADADRRWQRVLDAVGGAYHGAVYWALPLDALRRQPYVPAGVDGVVVLWSPDLGADPQRWPQATAALLAQEVRPFVEKMGKPVILAVSYPSAAGAHGGCVLLQSGCLPQEQLFPGTAQAHHTPVDLARQQKAYEALLSAVNDAPWVQGVVSMNFYPAAALQGPSASVYGKPAAEVLRWWFSQWTP